MKNTVRVYIYSNDNEKSVQPKETLAKTLEAAGFGVVFNMDNADIIICIGGDGTFLRLLKSCNYSAPLIVGINTGHLGFFQEFSPEETEALVEILRTENYSVQHHRLLRASVIDADGSVTELKAINEFAVKSFDTKLVHLNMSIGSSFIERFSGDGLLFSTPAGSTAYNYSAGGGIADPRVPVLQVTPISPMNTGVFRCFTSSLLLPESSDVTVFADEEFNTGVTIYADGVPYQMETAKEITIGYADEEIKLIRKFDYDFWALVQSKFL